MKSRWSDSDAQASIEWYAAQGVTADLALRTYSSRLLGSDPRLVLHGGGNTSVKTTLPDAFGHAVEALCVKGSGWDLATIEPQGHPALRLEALRQLRNAKLTDVQLINYFRQNLLDTSAPNPSVETLTHAYAPHKFVDHTHSVIATAIGDQPESEAICRAIYGDRVAWMRYVMPGFDLSIKTAEISERFPAAQGMLLANHGIFTYGPTAKASYELMIEFVTLAEEYIAANGRGVPSHPGRVRCGIRAARSLLAVRPAHRGTDSHVRRRIGRAGLRDARRGDPRTRDPHEAAAAPARSIRWCDRCVVGAHRTGGRTLHRRVSRLFFGEQCARRRRPPQTRPASARHRHARPRCCRHQHVASTAMQIMRKQRLGGVLLFNVSKQAVNPGASFGAYGTSKAALLALVRQYALEHGADGIRANAVNADRIRSGLLTDAFIAERARARGVSEAQYMGGNLLGREVLADDVVQAFVASALLAKTTGNVVTVDGGNVAAMLR